MVDFDYVSVAADNGRVFFKDRSLVYWDFASYFTDAATPLPFFIFSSTFLRETGGAIISSPIALCWRTKMLFLNFFFHFFQRQRFGKGENLRSGGYERTKGSREFSTYAVHNFFFSLTHFSRHTYSTVEGTQEGARDEIFATILCTHSTTTATTTQHRWSLNCAKGSLSSSSSASVKATEGELANSSVSSAQEKGHNALPSRQRQSMSVSPCLWQFY